MVGAERLHARARRPLQVVIKGGGDGIWGVREIYDDSSRSCAMKARRYQEVVLYLWLYAGLTLLSSYFMQGSASMFKFFFQI